MSYFGNGLMMLWCVVVGWFWWKRWKGSSGSQGKSLYPPHSHNQFIEVGSGFRHIEWCLRDNGAAHLPACPSLSSDLNRCSRFNLKDLKNRDIFSGRELIVLRGAENWGGVIVQADGASWFSLHASCLEICGGVWSAGAVWSFLWDVKKPHLFCWQSQWLQNAKKIPCFSAKTRLWSSMRCSFVFSVISHTWRCESVLNQFIWHWDVILNFHLKLKQVILQAHS